MPRKTPGDRIERLVDCATEVFITQGYTRTQMADVADALGVAKGTLYLAVESKEALFDLVLRYADVPRPFADKLDLPVRTPKRGTTLTFVRERLAQAQTPSTLAAALARTDSARNTAHEVEAILRELYDTLASNRTGIKLVDRCARDYPELASLWFEGARSGLAVALERYLASPRRRRILRPFPAPAVIARMLIETLVFWAVHRHWDTHPQAVDEAAMRDSVVRFLVAGLLKESH
jgi:AcrR family transcriptional regulator